MVEDKKIEDKETQKLREFKEQIEGGVEHNVETSEDTNQKVPEVIFNTHKFMYTLYHNGQIKGHSIVFTNRDGEEQKINLEKIEIGASPVSARFFDTEGNRYLIPFPRVKKVFRGEELVWEGSDTDDKNVKVIKGI